MKWLLLQNIKLHTGQHQINNMSFKDTVPIRKQGLQWTGILCWEEKTVASPESKIYQATSSWAYQQLGFPREPKLYPSSSLRGREKQIRINESAFLLISVLFLHLLIHDFYICFVTFLHFLSYLHYKLFRVMRTKTSFFPESNFDTILGLLQPVFLPGRWG